MGQKVILKKSNVEGKIPSANTMDFGEVYVNYASGNCNSFLATKKYDGTVAQFMERQYTDKVSMLAYKTKSDDLDGRWNVDVSGVTEYYEGLSFNVRLEKGYNTTYNVINVNGLGYKFVFVRRGTRLTSHYGQYSELRLTYRTDASTGVTASFNLDNIISGVSYTDGFVVENYYDTTNVDALRNTYAANQASERITRYQILGVDSDNRLMPLTLVPTGDYNTSGTKPVNTRGFRPDKFFFYSTTGIVATNSNFSSHSYLYETYSFSNGLYTFNSTLTTYKQIYLCGTYDSETDLFYLDTGLTSFYVLVPSNTSGLTLSDFFTDGKDYVYLGSTYSSENYFALFANHPLYHFDGTNLIRHEYSTIIEDELVTAIALNDLNTKLNVMSGSVATKEQASEYAGAALANAIVYIENVSGNIHTALTDDEYVISAALADLDNRMTSMSTTTISLIRDELLSISATIDTVVNESIEEINNEISAFSGNIISELIKDEYAIATSLTDLDERIKEVSGNVSTMYTDLNDYVTSANVYTAINNIQNDISGFSGSIISELIDDEYVTAIALNELDNNISNVEHNLNTYYATSADVYSAIAAGGGGGGGDISGYATSANTYNAIDSVNNRFSDYAVSSSTYGSINYVNSRFEGYATSANTYNAINDVKNSLTNIYKYKGSVTNYTDLPQSNNVVGDVWNVVNANGTTPAGTNYAWDGTSWDALGGSVDLSTYVQTGTLLNYATKAESSEYAAAALSNSVNYTDSSLASYATSANTYGSIAEHASNTTLHVTSSEKSTWNGKQNAISDLDTIRNNASSGATAYTTITAHTADTTIHFTTGTVKTQIESYGYTTNIGTVTGVSINGSTKTPSNGLVTLGTVLTAFTETDPTVPDWAKQSTKPTYTASEVGALATGTTLDGISDGSTRKLSNYATVANFTAHTADSTSHVTSTEKSTWNGKQNAISDLDTIRNNASSGATAYTTITAHTADTTIHFTTGTVKTQIESYGYTTNIGTVTGVSINGSTKTPSNGLVTLGTVLTAFTETDPTVPAWAKADSKPTYTASEVGALPTGTTLDNISDGSTRKLSNYATVTNFNSHTGDTTAHVTSTEKSTWNGKQNAISDLDTIRNNASSGATAYTNMVTGVTAGGTNLTKTNKVVAIPSASSSTFGVIKVGNFLSNSNGSISVSTGTTNTTVAVGNHTHSGYATTGNLDTLSSQTRTHIQSTTLHLPTVTSSDNGKILQVVNGAWALVTPVSIFSGSTAPDNLLGNNGDIYLQI